MLKRQVNEGAISFEQSLSIRPEISSGPVALFVSMLSSISLVSAMLIVHEEKFGFTKSLIEGSNCNSESCLVKFDSKNELNKNAFLIGVCGVLLSRCTFSGLLRCFVFALSRLQKRLGLEATLPEQSFI